MHIKIVGDIIPHHQVVASCCTGKNQYDFTDIFKYIIPDLKSDFTICNFESAFSKTLNFVGHLRFYPQFKEYYNYLLSNTTSSILINSPEGILKECLKIFDGFCIANNHIYDAGHKDFLSFVDCLKSNNKTVFGISGEQSIITLNNTTIGIYNYSKYIKKVKMYPGVTINTGIDDVIMHYLKDNSDILIVIPHWGKEYNNDASYIQQDFNLLKKYNPDCIIGHHSHMLSDIRYMNSIPVIQSLGNFLTGQILPETNIGAICDISINNRKITDISLIKTKCFNAGEYQKSFCIVKQNEELF